MQFQRLFTVISISSIAVQVKSECTGEQLNTAQVVFKNCMDCRQMCQKMKHKIASAWGCKEPVTQFAVCRGRGFVGNLVAIHSNASVGEKVKQHMKKGNLINLLGDVKKK